MDEQELREGASNIIAGVMMVGIRRTDEQQQQPQLQLILPDGGTNPDGDAAGHQKHPSSTPYSRIWNDGSSSMRQLKPSHVCAPAVTAVTAVTTTTTTTTPLRRRRRSTNAGLVGLPNSARVGPLWSTLLLVLVVPSLLGRSADSVAGPGAVVAALHIRPTSVAGAASSATATGAGPRREQRLSISRPAASAGSAAASSSPSSLLSQQLLHPLDRRDWLRRVVVASSGGAAGVVATAAGNPQAAHAGGLLQFPVGRPETQPLKNRYHFMRAGPSQLEVEGIYSTNPLFLTNRAENAMDLATGEAIVLRALAKMKREASDLFPTVAFHSLAANGMDTADLVARTLRLGREKLLPEFTYLDPRGVGMWDSADVSTVLPAVWALDVTEGGPMGMGGRPPPNTDGTPNETLHDQFIRLRQFLSLQESRTAGGLGWWCACGLGVVSCRVVSCRVASCRVVSCHAVLWCVVFRGAAVVPADGFLFPRCDLFWSTE
jgi:hypothetical protein